MSKLARQYLRSVKVWGIGAEQEMTRKQSTHMNRSFRLHKRNLDENLAWQQAWIENFGRDLP